MGFYLNKNVLQQLLSKQQSICTHILFSSVTMWNQEWNSHGKTADEHIQYLARAWASNTNQEMNNTTDSEQQQQLHQPQQSQTPYQHHQSFQHQNFMPWDGYQHWPQRQQQDFNYNSQPVNLGYSQEPMMLQDERPPEPPIPNLPPPPPGADATAVDPDLPLPAIANTESQMEESQLPHSSSNGEAAMPDMINEAQDNFTGESLRQPNQMPMMMHQDMMHPGVLHPSVMPQGVIPPNMMHQGMVGYPPQQRMTPNQNFDYHHHHQPYQMQNQHNMVSQMNNPRQKGVPGWIRDELKKIIDDKDKKQKTEEEEKDTSQKKDAEEEESDQELPQETQHLGAHGERYRRSDHHQHIRGLNESDVKDEKQSDEESEEEEETNLTEEEILDLKHWCTRRLLAEVLIETTRDEIFKISTNSYNIAVAKKNNILLTSSGQILPLRSGGLVGYSSDEDSEEDDVHNNNNNNGGSDDDFISDDEVFLNDLALEAKREKFEKAQNERLNDLLDESTNEDAPEASDNTDDDGDAGATPQKQVSPKDENQFEQNYTAHK